MQCRLDPPIRENAKEDEETFLGVSAQVRNVGDVERLGQE